MDSDFRPCRVIRGFGNPSYGIFDMPFQTIDAAVRRAFSLSENRQDFQENFTVVQWFGDDGPAGMEYMAVPEETIRRLKEAVL